MKLQVAIRTLIETGILKISVYGKSSPLSLNRKTSEKLLVNSENYESCTFSDITLYKGDFQKKVRHSKFLEI